MKALNYFGLELGESSFGALKLVGGVGAFFGGCQVLCEGRLGQIHWGPDSFPVICS